MIRSIVAAALFAGQLAGPAAAADIVQDSPMAATRAGSFAGARIRLSLGGGGQPLRAGLVAAPMLRAQAADGRGFARFGEGVELGIRSGTGLRVSMAGQDFGRRNLDAAADEEDEDGSGPSTWLLVAGGVVVALGVGTLLFVDAMNDASE